MRNLPLHSLFRCEYKIRKYLPTFTLRYVFSTLKHSHLSVKLGQKLRVHHVPNPILKKGNLDYLLQSITLIPNLAYIENV